MNSAKGETQGPPTGPIPKAPFDKRWYGHTNGKIHGPHTAHDIRRKVGLHQVSGTDLFHAEGGSAWIPAARDPVLAPLFQGSEAPKAAPGFRPSRRRLTSRYITATAGAVFAFVLMWMAWPYYAVYDLINGVREGDVSALENRVDWESVRQSLRGDLNALFIKTLNSEGKSQVNSPLGTGFAAMLGPAIVNQMVDGYVTPQGVAALVSKKPVSVSSNSEPKGLPVSAVRDFDWQQVRYAFFSGSPLTFKVDVIPKRDPAVTSSVTLIFKWTGGWKLTRISLPPDIFQQAADQIASVPVKTDNSSPLGTAVSAGANDASAPSPSDRKEPTPLLVTLITKGFKKSNIEAGDFEDGITFELSIKNATEKNIRAFDGTLRFTDLLDNDIMASKLAINESVLAGSTLSWIGVIKYNQFIDSHRRLRSEGQNNLKIKFQPRKILFADGSSKDYH